MESEETPYSGHWVYVECPLHEPTAVRLLELHPGPRDARTPGPKQPVTADLVLCSLDNAAPYIALSYSWGELPADTQVFIGPLATLSISQHLDDVLRQLRDPGKIIRVWVDALCINQADLDERSRQVSLMKQIFSTADSVYIWLGLSPDIPVVRSMDDGPDSGDLRWLVALNRDTRENEKFVGLSTKDLDYLLSWKEHAWWRRKWVLQEIAVARLPPMVLFDDYVFDGWAFFRAWPMELVYSREWDIKVNDNDFQVVGTQKIWKAFMSAEQSMKIPWKLRSWWEYYEVPLDGGRPLGELLRLAASSRASHDLDHVFGLIGLASPFHRALIPVDYNRNPKSLFTDASRILWMKETNPAQHTMIKESENSSFDVLAFQWDRYASPSWVCNLASATSVDRTDYQTWVYVRETQAASSASKDSPLSPPEGRMLSTDGDELVVGRARKRWSHHNVFVPQDIASSTEFSDIASASIISLDGFSIDVVQNVVTVEHYSQHPDAWHAITKALKCDPKALQAVRLGFSRYAEVEMSPAQFASFTFFTTSNSHIGICHTGKMQSGEQQGPLSGDQIVLILGANSPFIIRTSADHAHMHTLVGACMLSNDVCGCRNGEVHTITEIERFIIC